MKRRLDQAAIAGIALGFGFLMQPWWGQGLRTGFFLTLFATILHVVTSHLVRPGGAS